ncbi:FtsX-like permease family protein [Leptobacterium flavescens]|uniref:FtsX-like permease family protein n=1 Tax=Leptobacterium flavescens TaxID=472055 RepID=A0A6P0UU60_9FLAO|nr:ABC transporter permease [Leptobacterium flavescens]NER14353.1 FtsX-like permease family protein [Leptobacterium flavescens]
MIRNYIKVAFRSLMKNKAYAIINILGLSLGLMVALIVYLYVKHETSYDKHFEGSDRIYRIGLSASIFGQEIDNPASCSPMAHAFRTEFANVETATRINDISKSLLIYDETRLYFEDGVQVDSSFFKVFNYDFVYGNPATATTEDNAIVLSENAAKSLFGNEDPMGKIVNWDDRRDYIVRGVVKEPKGKSHFHFDYFLGFNDNSSQAWTSNNFYTYVKIREGVDRDDFYDGMVANFTKKVAAEVEQFLKITLEEFLATDGNSFQYFIQPLESIHLHSHYTDEIEQNGNIQYIYVFVAIALLVILIAGINFMNLSTARAGKRAKEVGMRKVFGATKKMLVLQFLIESVIQSFLALFIAFILVELFLPGFNNVMQTELSLFNSHFINTLLFAVLITFTYGIFAGSYPAFFLSNFQPITVLKGDLTKTKGGVLLRKALVVTQFSAATVLIIGMIIIFMQISYMQNKDLGFQGDQVLLAPIQTLKMSQNFETYKKEFLKNPGILSVSAANGIPGETHNNGTKQMVGREDFLFMHGMEVDPDYLATLDIELVKGKAFTKRAVTDSTIHLLLNETTVKSYNLKDPIGAKISIDLGDPIVYGTVIGVVKDFHYQGFNQEIKPLMLEYDPSDQTRWTAMMKISPENMNETISAIEELWNKFEPSHPFSYSFLDEDFAELYQQQKNFGSIFLFMTILAIIISAMGLYGLASYTAQQRTKEIGVRKVMGASVSQLMKMLTKDFIKLVMIANIFAWPVSFLLVKNWLSNFSYQIDLPFFPFVFATLLAVIIALSTVSYQAFNAANADPVRALKYE